MKFFPAVTIFAVLLLGAGCVPSTPTKPIDSAATGLNGGTAAENGGFAPDETAVDLSGRGLTAFPVELLGRRDVTSLDLSDNELTGALPAEIGRMQSLRELNLSGNRMTGVPAEVGHLWDLRILDLSDNELTGLPLELGELRKLEVLDLSGNPYSEVDLAAIKEDLPETTEIRR